MKLDPTVLRTMSGEDFRVLEAVEKGMRDHALVPLPLISALAGLRHGGAAKLLSTLLRDKLLSHECKRGNLVDGYRLTNAGYDILALNTLKRRGTIAALGRRIGTGKESDVYLACDKEGKQLVLKFHRLGRISFRNVKKKRDYFGSAAQSAHSWLFLSRLSALKEFAFLKALYEVNYPTPTPLGHNRHVVAMSLVRGMPLYQVLPSQLSADQAASIYQQATALAARLLQHGLVHCDLNEFNLLVDLSGIQAAAVDAEDAYVRHSGQSVAGEASVGALSKPAWEQSLEAGDSIELPEPQERLDSGEPKPVVVLIDFPQMISRQHPNAQELYERDLACLRRFFERKLRFSIPSSADDGVEWAAVTGELEQQLDTHLRASGYTEDDQKYLELYYFESGPRPIVMAVEEEEEEEEEEDDDDESKSDSDECPEELHSGPGGKGPANDNDSIGSEPDQQSQATYSQAAFDIDEVQSMSRSQLEEIARSRVRRQMEEQKRRSKRAGAFRKRNSNKTFAKGKRVMQDAGF